MHKLSIYWLVNRFNLVKKTVNEVTKKIQRYRFCVLFHHLSFGLPQQQIYLITSFDLSSDSDLSSKYDYFIYQRLVYNSGQTQITSGLLPWVHYAVSSMPIEKKRSWKGHHQAGVFKEEMSTEGANAWVLLTRNPGAEDGQPRYREGLLSKG